MMLSSRHLLLFFATISTVFSEGTASPAHWFNPPDSVGPTTDYSTNPVYVVGETTELHWATIYSNYSIALWQEDPSGTWAKLGPIIYQTFEPGNDLFNWSVSALRFNLSASNVFFLWLYPGSSTSQGSDKPKDSDQPSVTSHYFNITEAEEVVTTSSSTVKSTASSSTSTPAPATLSASSASTTTSSSSPVSSTDSTANSIPATSQPSSGLNTVAWAGVGIGIAILAIGAIVAGCFWYRRRKKRSLQSTVRPRVPGHSELAGWRDRTLVIPVKQRWPAEVVGSRSPVELAVIDGFKNPHRISGWRRPPMSPRELPG